MPIRIGLILDKPAVRGWEYAILEEIIAEDWCKIVVIIEDTCQPKRRFGGPYRHLSRLVWQLVDGLDNQISTLLFRRSRTQGFDIDQFVPVSRLGISFAHLRLCSQAGDDLRAQQLTVDELARAHSLDVDVLLRFGANTLKGDILRVVPYGIWSLRPADISRIRGGPAGFWEVYLGLSVTGATLLAQTGEVGRETILRRGFYATEGRSWNENRRRLHCKARFLVVEALRALATTRALPIEPQSEPHALYGLYCNKLYVVPSPFQTFRAGVLVMSRLLAGMLRRALWKEQWRLLFYHGNLDGISLQQFRSAIPPADRFWADPFLIKRENEVWVFFEDYCYRNKKGRISCMPLSDTACSRRSVILETPYHLSYPFLFTHGEELYMIPELHVNRSIDLWRCTVFPNKWQHERTIMSGISAVDTTVFQHNGTWWMFTNCDRTETRDYCELHIFYSDDPVVGQWFPHAANPVLVDARQARMAGSVIAMEDGRLIRCAQRHGPAYGAALLFCEIMELTPSRYRERIIEEVTPHWHKRAFAMHHFNSVDGTAIIDLCVRVPRLLMLGRRPS